MKQLGFAVFLVALNPCLKTPDDMPKPVGGSPPIDAAQQYADPIDADQPADCGCPVCAEIGKPCDWYGGCCPGLICSHGQDFYTCQIDWDAYQPQDADPSMDATIELPPPPPPLPAPLAGTGQPDGNTCNVDTDCIQYLAVPNNCTNYGVPAGWCKIFCAQADNNYTNSIGTCLYEDCAPASVGAVDSRWCDPWWPNSTCNGNQTCDQP